MPIIAEFPHGFRFELYGTDKNLLELNHVRTTWECHDCGCKIPSGSYCFGKQYPKVCLKCSGRFLNKIKNAFQREIDKINELKRMLKSNKSKFIAANTLASLKSEESEN